MVTEFRTSSRNKHVPSEWREKRCDCCGKFFLARGREWSSPLYCSARCVGEARNERRRAARLLSRISASASSVGLLSSISDRHGAIARCAAGSPLTTRK